MQKIDTGGVEHSLVVTCFLPKIDDGAHAMLRRKLRRTLHGEASADSHIVGQPVKIRAPIVGHTRHSFFFIFFCTSIFFFIIGDISLLLFCA
jgi:hypothetical protein